MPSQGGVPEGACVAMCVKACRHHRGDSPVLRTADCAAGHDGEAQRGASASQHLGDLTVWQGRHAAALHCLQPVARTDLPAAGCRAAPAHCHKAMWEQGGSCGETGVGDQREEEEEGEEEHWARIGRETPRTAG